MDTPILKSKSDQRLYRTLKLQNELQCLIVSDPEAQKSSAALSVGVGSLQDPLDAQGLAHYLEHMLFMGTEKYPDENDYSNFINKHSGSNNAYTSQQETNYQLEVSSNAFAETLDRFAQFFIGPLMSDSSSERELNAVHSEHSKNLQNDAWRKYHLSKHISKKGHPFGKFSTGDKSTLSNPNLRKMLLDFYNKHYSANLMKLVVYGSEKPETMAEWIKNMFSAIPNKKYSKYQMREHPYDDGAFNKMFKIVPVKDKKSIQMQWILKLKSGEYRNHPGKYVSHMIGHEGKGSLLSFLMKEGLATGLNSYYDDEFNCYTEFNISIDLTQKGISHLKDIIEYTLFYFKMLKDIGPQKWIFEELQDIQKMKFDYMEKKKGMMRTAKLAKFMHDRKIQQILIYHYLMESWKPQTITEFLNEVSTTNNLIVFAEAQEFESECNITEPIYSTKYCEQLLGELSPKKCDVGLPEKNHFIPKDLSILPLGDKTLPEKFYESKYVEAHYKKDHRFSLPKVTFNMRLFYDGAFTVGNEVRRKLFISMMQEDLREFVYLAEVAELEASLKFVSYYNADMSISGFRDSVLKFIESYFQKVLEYKPNNEDLFKTMKEKLIRKYSNNFLDDPYRFCYDSNVRALRDSSQTSPIQKLNQAKAITLKDVAQFAESWKKALFCEVFIAGNVQKTDSEKIMKGIQTLVSKSSEVLPSCLYGSIRAVQIPKDRIVAIQRQLKSTDEENSAFSVHFQAKKVDIRQSLLLKLCETISSEPAFDYLRTKQQLGYIVFCMHEDNRGVGGLSFLVQSAVKTSYQILAYFQTFLNTILKAQFEKLDEKTFNEYTNSLKITKQEKDKNLTNESRRFWTEITKHTFVFDRKEKQIEEIPSITLEEFRKFSYDLLYNNPKRYQMHLTSHREHQKNESLKEKRLKEGNFEIFSGEEEFRSVLPLFPDYYRRK